MLFRWFRSSPCIKFDNATTVRLGGIFNFRFGVPMISERNIAVVGLGYVGLPLAVALSKKFPVIGYDRDSSGSVNNGMEFFVLHVLTMVFINNGLQGCHQFVVLYST